MIILESGDAVVKAEYTVPNYLGTQLTEKCSSENVLNLASGEKIRDSMRQSNSNSQQVCENPGTSSDPPSTQPHDEASARRPHPKLIKQKSVTFGNVETAADGIVTSILNLANNIQSEVQDQNPENPPEDLNSVQNEQLSNSQPQETRSDENHLHHHHHHHHIHHHLAQVTLQQRNSISSVSSRRGSSQRSGRSSLTSTDPGHLRRALRETWDSQTAFFLACLCCTVGMFNINKFALLVVRYGFGFVFEFILLSILFGIPLFSMYVKLGQYVRTGIISMWSISPAFYGVGITIVIMNWLIGIFSAIPIVWMISFFRDSFVSGKTPYKWRGCNYEYALRECVTCENDTSRIGIEISSYFHGRILGQVSDNESGFGKLSFENIVFLTFIWAIVFFCLSRGLKWYSKVIYVIAFVPEISILALFVKLMHQREHSDIASFLCDNFLETLSDGMSWFAAAKEVCFTWIIFGAIVLQMASHSKKIAYTNSMLIALVCVTNFVLILFGCGLAGCLKLMQKHGLHIIPSSFESESTSNFVSVDNNGTRASIHQLHPVNLLFGTYFTSENNSQESRYHVMRFATELFPATMALKQIEDEATTFWCALFYLTMIFFGVGQQMVFARSVTEALIDAKPMKFSRWRTTVTLVVCLSMLLLGIPLLSSKGMKIFHFFDFTVGTLWWVILIYFLISVGTFHIKGELEFVGHQATYVATDDNMSLLAYIAHQSIKPKFLAVTFVINWNIICPAILLVLFAVFLRINDTAFIFEWVEYPYAMWSTAGKSTSVILPMLLLLLPSFVFLYLVFYHFSKVRMQTTLRRVLEDLFQPTEPLPKWPQTSRASRTHSIASRTSSLSSRIFNFGLYDDPPPKYTPPPSYSSATAKSLIKDMGDLTIEMNMMAVSDSPDGSDDVTTIATSS
ncbi:Sodium- and chloride-dependent GABA transporter 3 [Nymphon striatum]|nr:Sodium- and chloride-dependent GABA transporter 3 [Nymphon striatum]